MHNDRTKENKYIGKIPLSLSPMACLRLCHNTIDRFSIFFWYFTIYFINTKIFRVKKKIFLFYLLSSIPLQVTVILYFCFVLSVSSYNMCPSREEKQFFSYIYSLRRIKLHTFIFLWVSKSKYGYCYYKSKWMVYHRL